MTVGVTLIDYGMENLFSVTRAFEQCGARVFVTDDPKKIAEAPRLVLPGVGAFASGMAGLRDRGLIESIKTFAVSGRPFLGICLGMQMMLDKGEEFGNHEGLGLIPGRVVAIPKTGVNGLPHKIPHIGWNALHPCPGGPGWSRTLLEGIPEGATVYFVHSFTPVPEQARHRLADTEYNGRVISGVIQSGMLYGCQFHPEKSGPIGLHILKNFLNLPVA